MATNLLKEPQIKQSYGGKSMAHKQMKDMPKEMKKDMPHYDEKGNPKKMPMKGGKKGKC